MTVNKRRLNTFLTYYAQLDINKISNKRTDQYIYIYLTFIYLRLFFFVSSISVKLYNYLIDQLIK